MSTLHSKANLIFALAGMTLFAGCQNKNEPDSYRLPEGRDNVVARSFRQWVPLNNVKFSLYGPQTRKETEDIFHDADLSAKENGFQRCDEKIFDYKRSILEKTKIEAEMVGRTHENQKFNTILVSDDSNQQVSYVLYGTRCP